MNQALTESIQTTPLVFPSCLSKEVADASQNVEEGNARLLRITELIDPREPLLSAIYENDKVFPPNSMRQTDWLQFLRKMGMVSKLSFEVIKQAALRIEERCDRFENQCEPSNVLL